VIIRSIKAEGFMKYEHLELTDLPSGAIAVEGENEAGKTTLGEAVAFGLFGRTVRTEETDPSQAIHWDSERAATTVEFELKNTGNNGELAHREEGVYKIERTIERSGHSEARLYSPRGQLLGGSHREVAKALTRVLGFSFPEFRYSFYVAQKELDLVRHATRDNTRRIIYDMLGITAVERARSLVQRELEESKERSRTLERDLVVARALLNEAQGDREHGDSALKDHESAETDAAQAATVEETARAAREKATALTDARRDALTSFGRLEGAIVLGTQRAHLAAARRDLANAEKAAQAHAEKAQSVLQQGERPRAEAKTALERARTAREAARALAAVVDARSAQLKSELAAAEGRGEAGSGLSLGERTARETERAQRLQTKAGRRMLLSVVLLLFAVVLGGGAAGMLLPDAEKPFLGQFYKGDASFTLLGHTIGLTHFVMALILGGLGAVSIVWSFFIFVGRRALTSEIRESEGDLEKLSGAVTKLKADLAAYEGFDTKRLRDIEVKAKRIEDPAVARALQGFKDAAQGADQSDLSADAAVEDAQKRLDQLERDRSGAEPRFQEASRIQRGSRRALDLADAAMGDATKKDVPSDELMGLDLAALEQHYEQAAANAARARIEIEALQAAGQDGTVPEAGRALNEALARIYEARPEAKGVYEQQTGLRALLDALRSGTLPSPEDLRDTLKREREVLRQALGTEEESRTLLAQAEEGYRRARDNRARLESRLAEARARGERAQIGRSRSAELEVKVAGLEEVLGPIAHELEVREECLRLQEDLIKAMKSRFGPGIARYIEVILPRLTGGRYKRTRIDEDLDVRVFSNERGDFVRLVDISFGTADQVLLALRLGLARALVASRGLHGAHFLFLDEPLASADESRGQAFLELLRSFDDEFAQVFVTSTRPLDGAFSKRINLQTATRVLKV
jgi:exonuclease SbcC